LLGPSDEATDSQLLVLDLSRNFTNQDVFPYTSLGKPPNVPSSLIEHALWFSRATKRIYQLGGWFSFNGKEHPSYVNDPDLPRPAIWEFDIDGRRWSIADDFRPVHTGDVVDRPGAAAYCDAPSLNRSYIFEGFTQRRSGSHNANFTAISDFRCQ
jgi:hypothetical protein